MMTKADWQIFYGLFFRSGEIKAVAYLISFGKMASCGWKRYHKP